MGVGWMRRGGNSVRGIANRSKPRVRHLAPETVQNKRVEKRPHPWRGTTSKAGIKASATLKKKTIGQPGTLFAMRLFFG
jgi:hypothetical protein